MWMILGMVRDWLRRLFRVAPRCEYPGCGKRDPVGCWHDDQDWPDSYYCPEHASLQGYCWSCGGFWSGIERFDFSSDGLCENCHDDIGEDEDFSDEMDFESEYDLYGDM